MRNILTLACLGLFACPPAGGGAPAPRPRPAQEGALQRLLGRHVRGHWKGTWDGNDYAVALWPDGRYARVPWNYRSDDSPVWEGGWRFCEHTGVLSIHETQVSDNGWVTTDLWSIRFVPHADGFHGVCLRGFVGWPDYDDWLATETDTLLVLRRAPLQ